MCVVAEYGTHRERAKPGCYLLQLPAVLASEYFAEGMFTILNVLQALDLQEQIVLADRQPNLREKVLMRVREMPSPASPISCVAETAHSSGSSCPGDRLSPTATTRRC